MTGTKPSDEVILHVADHPEDVTRATAAGAALVQADPALRVRIIVNGPALGGVTDDAQPAAPVDGVSLQACQIGLRRRGFAADQLQSGIGTIESAVVAIVQAQRDGASYMRL